MPANNLNEPEKKSKLHFFGKRDKHRDNPSSTAQPTDSGYATSENPSQLNPSSDVTATTTNSEPQTQSQNRDLVVDPPTGNVIDRDTGDVVTTVTTTTTTTTTTTANRNGERHVKTEPVNVEKQQRYDELNNAQRDSGFGSASQLHHDSTNNTALRDGIYDNNSNRNSGITDSTVGMSNRNNNDVTSATINPAYESANLTTTNPGVRPGESPPVPARSAMREPSRNRDIAPSATGGMDMTPPHSPTKHNFSYPTRQPPNSMPSYQAANEKIPVVDDPVRTTNQPGTLANLKTAAAGLHGVGETLRGTLNSSIDKRFGHASPETLAHNQQTLDAGRAEIETGRFHDSVKEREKAHTVGKIMRKPVNQDGREESGNLRVVNQ